MPGLASQVTRRQLASMAVIAVTELQKKRLDRLDQPEAVQNPFPPFPKRLGIVLVDELKMRGLRVVVAAVVSLSLIHI